MHGGTFGNEKQLRLIKLHANGDVSYWKGDDMRGIIQTVEAGVCTNPNQFFIKSKKGRKYEFEDI